MTAYGAKLVKLILAQLYLPVLFPRQEALSAVQSRS